MTLLAPVIILSFILMFVLVSGLIVLWRRGAGDLDAWGLFVLRILHGDARFTPEAAALKREKPPMPNPTHIEPNGTGAEAPDSRK